VTQGQAITCSLGLKDEDINSSLLIAATDNGMIYDQNKYQYIENFELLKRLDIYSAPYLRSISDLLPLSGNLTNLTLEKCLKIEDMEIIGELSKLETLVLQNSAPIPSVQFIENFKNLKYAYIGVEILDGRTDILDYLGIEYKKIKKYKK
jgi:hypothetical protein